MTMTPAISMCVHNKSGLESPVAKKLCADKAKSKDRLTQTECVCVCVCSGVARILCQGGTGLSS